MAGYAMRKDLSQGVHDPLSTRAIAFEEDGKRLVLVSADLVGFYGGTADSMRKAILAACKLQPSELFLAAIHTHGGPNLTLDAEKGPSSNVEYTKTLETQLVDVVQDAMGHLVPCRLSVGFGSSPIGVNRRENRLDKAGKPVIALGRNPYGPTDKEVQVLKVSQADSDQLVAVVFAYATHSTAMGQTNYQITGDVHGLAEQFIEKYLNHGVVAPGFAGASGNIDPWFRVLPKFETADGWIPEPVLLGTMLGEEVVQVSNHVRNSAIDVPIKTAMKTVMLPGKRRDQDPADKEIAARAACSHRGPLRRSGRHRLRRRGVQRDRPGGQRRLALPAHGSDHPLQRRRRLPAHPRRLCRRRLRGAKQPLRPRRRRATHPGIGADAQGTVRIAA